MLIFGLAPAWEIAAAGRTLVGIGVAVTFVALLKICASRYPPERFATLNGITQLVGNLGAVAAGAPLAWRRVNVEELTTECTDAESVAVEK